VTLLGDPKELGAPTAREGDAKDLAMGHTVPLATGWLW